MKNKEVRKIINNFYKNLQAHINDITIKFDVESIHQFRVEYKMLRAFLRMITKQYTIPGKLTISKKLKSCYHILGTIRDLQLQNKRIIKASKKESKKTLEYRHLLQKEITHLKLTLIELFLSNPIPKSIRKSVAAIPGNLSQQNLIKFISHKWSVIHNIIVFKNLSDADIHAVRKHLKDLFYNMGIVDGIKDATLSSCIWEGKDEQYLNNLLELMGKYQDKCTAIALLKQDWLNSLTGINREFLVEQNKIWLLEKQQIKENLILQLKTGLSA